MPIFLYMKPCFDWHSHKNRGYLPALYYVVSTSHHFFLLCNQIIRKKWLRKLFPFIAITTKLAGCHAFRRLHIKYDNIYVSSKKKLSKVHFIVS